MAFTLTVLDKRPFAPPIESPPDRVLNMRNACERFGVSGETVSKLETAGFRSVSLLALASVERLSSLRLAKRDQVAVSTLLLTLNATPLEPLYSFKKLTHKKRSAEKKRRATVADRLDCGGGGGGGSCSSSEKPKKKQTALPSFAWLDLASAKENIPPQTAAAAALAALTRHPSCSGGGGAPQRKPSNSGSGLRYLAVVSFHPEDLVSGKKGSSVAVPSGVKRIQSMTRSATPSSSETKAAPQSAPLPPPAAVTNAPPAASPLKTSNKFNRTAGARSPSHCEGLRRTGHPAAPPSRTLGAQTGPRCWQCGHLKDKVSAFKNYRYCRGCWLEGRKGFSQFSGGSGPVMKSAAFCQHCQRAMPPAHAQRGRRLCSSCYFYTVGGGGTGGSKHSGHASATGFAFDAASVAAGSAFPLPCRNEKQGCLTVLPPAEIGLHEGRCPFSLLQCQWPGCLFVGTYYDHSRHTEIYHGGCADQHRVGGGSNIAERI